MESSETSNPSGVEFQDVQAAAQRIAPFAHRTPVVQNATLDRLAGAQLFFKCENLQKIGAFKFRGACNAVLQLDNEQAPKGVVTHSSGNHAQALALAARLREIPAWVVMPENAPQVKKDAVQGYGATIVECEPNQQARETTAENLVSETGATFIHPFNHPHIIAGQGTACLELMEDVTGLDAILAPIGGGGLISGCCVVASHYSENQNEADLNSVKVLAAEPTGADDAARSKASGELVTQADFHTIADGLLTTLGDLTWPFVRDVVSKIITVTDEEIISAMKLFWERTKLIIEPSSATVIAAAFKQDWLPGSRIGLILSGGNVDLKKLPW